MIRILFKSAKVGGTVLMLGAGTWVGANAIFGGDRVSDLLATVTASARTQADSLIDQRAALERRLSRMDEAYPKRIGELRALLREVETRLAEVEREQQVAAEVIRLAGQDTVALMAAMVDADADADGVDDVWHGGGAVRFNGRYHSHGELEALLTRAESTREEYRQRHNDAVSERELLGADRESILTALAELEAERETFQRERLAILREADRVQHASRMIELAEQRRDALNGLVGEPGAGDDGTLAGLRTALQQRRVEQEEHLRALRAPVQPVFGDYESRARQCLSNADRNADSVGR